MPDTPAKQALIDWHRANDALIAKAVKKNPNAVRDAFRNRYQHDASSFVRDCFRFLPGERIADYQKKAMDTLMERRRLAARALHGVGKSTLAAWITIWGVTTAEDVKVPTTAGAWRQLEKYLWPEIHKWMGRFRWELTGLQTMKQDALTQTGLRVSSTAEAFAVASDQPALIEGAHAKRLVFVFDESKAIIPATFDAAEGAFMGSTDQEVYALAISTPGEPAGRFYDICSRKRGYEDWAVMHITLEDAIQAGRANRKNAEQRKSQWGENSPMYRNRVLGEFAGSDENNVIPLSWVEAANDRWHEWKDSDGFLGDLHAIGVDVARSGDDKTVLAPRYGKLIPELFEYEKRDTMETTGNVVPFLVKHRRAQAVVDVIGVGAGVVDRLHEQNYNVVGFNAGEGTERTDLSGEMKFANKRAAAWWCMRELLDPNNGENIALPPHDLLTGDLVATTWSMTSTGKIKVESKDDIKKRIGRSTDHADAVIQSFWKEYGSGNVSTVKVANVRQSGRLIMNRHATGPLM